MIFPDISASAYGYSHIFSNGELKYIFSKIIECYRLMIADAVTLVNDENKIRDELCLNYLKNNAIRKSINLQGYLFEREVPEDRTPGRTDIKISSLNTFFETEAYYIIECKRLDAVNPKGKSGLNAKYISEGMRRFGPEKYSAHYKTNGMIGFVVQSLDIHANVTSINHLLQTTFKEANTTQALEYHEIVKDFEFSYRSMQTVGKESITLYHLMFDFSKNIQ